MAFEVLSEITNEQERVSKLYDIYDEDARLTKSKAAKVEFTTSLFYLEKALTQNSKVLDIGAGTGVYSLPLASKGHSVTAVELAPRNVEVFRSKIKESMDIRLIHGNALDLSMLEDSTFDIVLLFGPLYHLLEKEDRNTAIREAMRVLRDDGTLFISYINHDFIPFTESRHNPEWLAGDDYHHETFRLDDFPFVFFTLEECREMLEENGLIIEKEIASDGVSELLLENINIMSEKAYNQYLKYHFSLCEDKAFLKASNHFLFQCSKKNS